MNIPDECALGVERILDRAADSDQAYTDGVEGLCLLHIYGQKVFSQIGMGLCGWSLRQKGHNWLLTIKVVDSGTPLIAYISSHTPTGCVEQLFYLLESDKVSYHVDRYPWT